MKYDSNTRGKEKGLTFQSANLFDKIFGETTFMLERSGFRLSTNPPKARCINCIQTRRYLETEIKFGFHREKWNLHEARISSTFYLRDKLRVLRALWWNGVVKP